MTEAWSVLDDERRVSGAAAAALVTANVDDSQLTTCFRSDLGRLLVVVSNGTRSMVVLMKGEGDPGEHAVSPDAAGSSDGYVLENGQEDSYENADTVPVADALEAVRSIIDSGRPPGGSSWSVDR
ncbi:hypothetical protein JNB_06314 [Janibacter sp. HTCC2649]|uniref:hypothetical protein n=1 Tax=Janibacter sp. HTCC2649 TaxID=313589 RepID=UPI0000670D6B|nr:hypothetical protein [Janibacter sp. HTCC2649]EAP99760.1 hypothetical protein JNB_06314 [Janibacter sp. HTCC2649]